jgi:hypothetical protein
MGDDTFITKVVEEAIVRMVPKMNNMIKKLDTELAVSARSEATYQHTSAMSRPDASAGEEGCFLLRLIFWLRLPSAGGRPQAPLPEVRLPAGLAPQGEIVFPFQGMPNDHKVWPTSFHMEGSTQQWYFNLRRTPASQPGRNLLKASTKS